MADDMMEMGMCPQCREHCEFVKTDEHGEELDPKDPAFEETEAWSDCCGVPA